MTTSNPYQSPSTSDFDSPFDVSDWAAVRRKHFKTEAAFKTIGAAFFGVAFIVGAALIATCVAGWRTDNLGTVLLAGILFVPLVTIFLMVGRGLRNLEAWVRFPSAFLSIFLLVYLPIGTIIGGATLLLIFSEQGKQVFSRDYRQVIESTPEFVHNERLTYAIVSAVAIMALVLTTVWFGF